MSFEIKEKIEPQGNLAVHLKDVRLINFQPKEETSINWTHSMIKFTMQKTIKESKIKLIDLTTNTTKFHELKHFLIRLINLNKEKENFLKIELILIGVNNETKRKYLKIVSSHFVNMIDLIRVGFLSEEFNLRSKANLNQLVGILRVEMCFAYGTFGYGYSNQIETTTVKYSPFNYLRHCLFSRIAPPEYRQVNNEKILEAVTVDYPSFIKFNRAKSFKNMSNPSSELPFFYGKNQAQFPNLEKVFSETNNYYSLSLNYLNECHNRVERLNFLRSLLNVNENRVTL